MFVDRSSTDPAVPSVRDARGFITRSDATEPFILVLEWSGLAAVELAGACDSDSLNRPFGADLRFDAAARVFPVDEFNETAPIVPCKGPFRMLRSPKL